MIRTIAALALAFVAFVPLQAAPLQQEPECFPQTGQCISGRFREYWRQNGGLAVFGYPITPVTDEVNPDTGQIYPTQWFERNRFELHADEARPYDVQLGRLGDDRLRQLGRSWQTLPKGQETADCLWFDETEHSICPPFRGYWESHGLQDPALSRFAQSLALFGLPISEPAMEVNTSGDQVITQWFERARFECHPNNEPEYRVLLGLLGNEVRQNPAIPAGKPPVQCSASTQPPPPPPPSAPPPSFNNCRADPNAAQAPNTPVRIVGVDKADELVVLRNVSAGPIDLAGWIMCSITGNQRHEGIGGVLAAGETRAFPYTGPSPIWNNFEEDDGALYNPSGQLISYWDD